MHKKPANIWVRCDAVINQMKNVKIIRMEEQTKYQVSSEVSVVSLDANHDEKSFPQWLLFEIVGKKLLYAVDGSWFLTKTYNYLKNSLLDYLFLDATCGDYIGDYRMAEHNSIPMIKLMIPSLIKFGIISSKTQVYITHIATSLHKQHDEIVHQVKDMNIDVAYDGLSIEI